MTHARVRDCLDASAVSYRVHEHAALPVPIASPTDFAAALGYPLGRIMKTVLCHSRSTGTNVAIACSVDARMDLKLIAQHCDCGRLEVAKAADLEALTQYPRGSVSPLGLDPAIGVVVARRALDYDTVLVGGGVLGVEVEIAPADLVRITGARTLEF